MKHNASNPKCCCCELLALVDLGVGNLGNFLIAIEIFQHFDMFTTYEFWPADQKLAGPFPDVNFGNSKQGDANNLILIQ